LLLGARVGRAAEWPKAIAPSMALRAPLVVRECPKLLLEDCGKRLAKWANAEVV
jgi:hypothetical protein